MSSPPYAWAQRPRNRKSHARITPLCRPTQAHRVGSHRAPVGQVRQCERCAQNCQRQLAGRRVRLHRRRRRRRDLTRTQLDGIRKDGAASQRAVRRARGGHHNGVVRRAAPDADSVGAHRVHPDRPSTGRTRGGQGGSEVWHAVRVVHAGNSRYRRARRGGVGAAVVSGIRVERPWSRHRDDHAGGGGRVRSNHRDGRHGRAGSAGTRRSSRVHPPSEDRPRHVHRRSAASALVDRFAAQRTDHVRQCCGHDRNRRNHCGVVERLRQRPVRSSAVVGKPRVDSRSV